MAKTKYKAKTHWNVYKKYYIIGAITIIIAAIVIPIVIIYSKQNGKKDTDKLDTVSETASETTPDPCEGVRCGAHGSCTNGACVCVDGYTGINCEIAPEYCEIAPESCEGACAHGSCTNGACVCVDEYTGTNCDEIIIQEGEAPIQYLLSLVGEVIEGDLDIYDKIIKIDERGGKHSIWKEINKICPNPHKIYEKLSNEHITDIKTCIHLCDNRRYKNHWLVVPSSNIGKKLECNSVILRHGTQTKCYGTHHLTKPDCKNENDTTIDGTPVWTKTYLKIK